MIPIKIRRELGNRKDMKACCLPDCGVSPVEWNHSLQFSGKSLQEEYAIKPLCLKHHRQTNGSIDHRAKEYCEMLAIKEGLEHLQKNYPKFDWLTRLNYLSKKYENK